MAEEYPAPCTPEAVAKGCTCDPARQTSPNWQVLAKECPVHGLDYVIWKANQGGKRKKG